MAATPEEFKAATNRLVETVTSDEMVERMRAFKHLPPEDRLAQASKLLSVEGLKERGVEMPEGMRISSRYFESDKGTFEFGNVDGDNTALHKLAAEDPEFIEKLKVKHPDVYNKLKLAPSEALTSVAASGPDLAMGGCSGAGGGVGGTGGCACSGSSELL